MRSGLWLGLLFGSLTSSAALAQAGTACSGDIQKFCPDLKPGDGRVAQCLKAHDAQLSEACRAVGHAMNKQQDDLKAACSHEIETLCSGEQSPGRVRLCLKRHDAQLSDACRSASAAAWVNPPPGGKH